MKTDTLIRDRRRRSPKFILRSWLHRAGYSASQASVIGLVWLARGFFAGHGSVLSCLIWRKFDGVSHLLASDFPPKRMVFLCQHPFGIGRDDFHVIQQSRCHHRNIGSLCELFDSGTIALPEESIANAAAQCR